MPFLKYNLPPESNPSVLIVRPLELTTGDMLFDSDPVVSKKFGHSPWVDNLLSKGFYNGGSSIESAPYFSKDIYVLKVTFFDFSR